MLAACGKDTKGFVLTSRNLTDIYSPHYPQEYPSDLSCKWHIKADHGYQIKLTLLGFELEEK